MISSNGPAKATMATVATTPAIVASRSAAPTVAAAVPESLAPSAEAISGVVP